MTCSFCQIKGIAVVNRVFSCCWYWGKTVERSNAAGNTSDASLFSFEVTYFQLLPGLFVIVDKHSRSSHRAAVRRVAGESGVALELRVTPSGRVTGCHWPPRWPQWRTEEPSGGRRGCKQPKVVNPLHVGAAPPSGSSQKSNLPPAVSVCRGDAFICRLPTKYQRGPPLFVWILLLMPRSQLWLLPATSQANVQCCHLALFSQSRNKKIQNTMNWNILGFHPTTDYCETRWKYYGILSGNSLQLLEENFPFAIESREHFIKVMQKNGTLAPLFESSPAPCDRSAALLQANWRLNEVGLSGRWGGSPSHCLLPFKRIISHLCFRMRCGEGREHRNRRRQSNYSFLHLIWWKNEMSEAAETIVHWQW